MTASTSFVVTCRHCRAVVVTADRIGDEEANILEDHLCACRADLAAQMFPSIGALLEHYEFTSVKG